MIDVTNISTTRSEYLAKKRRLEQIWQGYNLLDKKRIALMQEILRLQKEVVKLAESLQTLSENARRSLARAVAFEGEEKVKSDAMINRLNVEINLRPTKFMGISIPEMEDESIVEDLHERNLSILGSSELIHETAVGFEQTVDAILVLANIELRLRILFNEFQRITRRLEALEIIVIPRMKAELHFIKLALDERERSDHFTLKLAKGMIDQRRIAKEKKLKLSVIDG